MSRLLLSTILAASFVAAAAGAPPAEVIGTGPLFHIVGDLDKSVAFYRGLFGIAAGNPAGPRTFTPDPELQQLYNLPAGRESAGVVRVPGLALSMEFVEWRDVDRTPVQRHLQDPGASALILMVRDIDKATTWLAQNGAVIITPGGKPVSAEINGGAGRLLFAKDPDGFFIEIRRPDTLPDSPLPSTTNVINARFGVTVDHIDSTSRFYRDALGFSFEDAGSSETDRGRAAAAGIAGAQYRRQTAQIPGSPVTMEIVEFSHVDRKAVHSRIQDPGTSMLQLSVRDINATVKALRESDALVITAGGSTLRHGSPISLVGDPNNFYLEPMQPAAK